MSDPAVKLAPAPGTIRFIVQDGQMILIAPDGAQYPVEPADYGSRC